MLKGRVKRAVKLGAIGVGILGSGYLLQKNDWEMSTVGVVRFGRAAIAVSLMGHCWGVNTGQPTSLQCRN